MDRDISHLQGNSRYHKSGTPEEYIIPQLGMSSSPVSVPPFQAQAGTYLTTGTWFSKIS